MKSRPDGIIQNISESATPPREPNNRKISRVARGLILTIVASVTGTGHAAAVKCTIQGDTSFTHTWGDGGVYQTTPMAVSRDLTSGPASLITALKPAWPNGKPAVITYKGAPVRIGFTETSTTRQQAVSRNSNRWCEVAMSWSPAGTENAPSTQNGGSDVACTDIQTDPQAWHMQATVVGPSGFGWTTTDSVTLTASFFLPDGTALRELTGETDDQACCDARQQTTGPYSIKYMRNSQSTTKTATLNLDALCTRAPINLTVNAHPDTLNLVAHSGETVTEVVTIDAIADSQPVTVPWIITPVLQVPPETAVIADIRLYNGDNNAPVESGDSITWTNAGTGTLRVGVTGFATGQGAATLTINAELP